MAIYTFDFSEEESWTLSDANISGGTLNITAAGGYGQRVPDGNWLAGANDDFEIEFDFKIDADWSYGNYLAINLVGAPYYIYFRIRGSVYDVMQIYYGWQRTSQPFVFILDTWYTAKIRRVGTIFYFSINGGSEISWNLGTARVIGSIRLGIDNITGKFDNFIYRWIEEGEIIKTFEDSGVGIDNLLVDKTLIFPDSGIGTDKWILPNITYIVFSDSGSGADAFKVDKTLVFSDAGSGIDIFKVDKTVIFSDLGEGVDVFLVDKEVIFKDAGVAIDKFRAAYPYPKGLKRKIIIIRDIK